MSETGNYIKLSRKMLRWEWYKDNVTKDLFLHLLLKAAYKPTRWRGIDLKIGQVITGRRQLADELGYSERQIRTALNHLEASQQVTSETTNQFTVLTIVNWRFYQGGDTESDQRNDQRSDQQPTSQLSQNRPANRPTQSKATTGFKGNERPAKRPTNDQRSNHNIRIEECKRENSELAAKAAELGKTTEEYLRYIEELRR